MPYDAADKLLEKGLRNIWYGICPSNFIGTKPVQLHRCGYRMVLWRDEKGKLYALEDYCPHRGAPMSLGINLGDRIACGYHGVQVDGNGVAVVVPGSPGCKLEGMKATKSFPVEEHAGLIFAYISDDKNGSVPPLVLPEQLTSPEYSTFLCYAEWGGDYRFVMDNVMDPMHGSYLHKQSHSMSFGEATAQFQIRDTDTGYVFEKVGQRNVNFDWTEWGETGLHWMRLEIPYPKTGGPGGNFIIVGTYTPISPTMSAVIHWRCRKVDGWQRDAWRFLYKNRLEARHWHVLEQDRVMIELYAPDARDYENLYQHDTGLVRLRRRMRTLAQQQIAADSANAA
jgi:phenylpropionate dioxygenase-like ring-hydroxylating dioxygenase large terminal subunit